MIQTFQYADIETVQVAGANPGAGANFASPVGDNSRRRLINLAFEVQCAAVAASRLVTILANPSGFGTSVLSLGPTLMTISQRWKLNFSINAPTVSVTPGGAIGFWQQGHLNPYFWLEPADQFNIIIYQMDAGDTIENITYTIQRQLLPNS